MIDTLKGKYKNLTSDKKFSEILTGSAYALAARIAATGLTLAATIIVARFYGAEAMGVLALVNSFLTLITIFTVLGTGTSILRLIPEHIAKYSVTSAFRVYRKTQYFVAAVSVVTGIIFFLAAGIVAEKVFSKPHLSFLFALSAGVVVFKSLMDLNTQAVRGLRLIRTFAVMQLLPALAMLVILIAVSVLFPHANNPVYAQLAAYGFTGIAGVWIMDRAFKNKMQGSDVTHPMAMREVLDISMPMLMTASMFFFIGQTGVIMLGMFRSESEVGYYSVAIKMATLTSFVLGAINSMAAPKFSELFHTGNVDELFRVARKSTKLIFWTTVPILMFLIIFGLPVLRVVFGKDFTVAYPALVLLVIGQFVNSISGSTGIFMNMTGQQKVFRNIIIISSVINVTVSIGLIPRFGLAGAAIAAMVSLCFWNICSLVYIKSKFGKTIGYVPTFTR
jgi:O-antigen/teichoic acid export membrane protein